MYTRTHPSHAHAQPLSLPEVCSRAGLLLLDAAVTAAASTNPWLTLCLSSYITLCLSSYTTPCLSSYTTLCLSSYTTLCLSSYTIPVAFPQPREKERTRGAGRQGRGREGGKEGPRDLLRRQGVKRDGVGPHSVAGGLACWRVRGCRGLKHDLCVREAACLGSCTQIQRRPAHR